MFNNGIKTDIVDKLKHIAERFVIKQQRNYYHARNKRKSDTDKDSEKTFAALFALFRNKSVKDLSERRKRQNKRRLEEINKQQVCKAFCKLVAEDGIYKICI